MPRTARIVIPGQPSPLRRTTNSGWCRTAPAAVCGLTNQAGKLVKTPFWSHRPADRMTAALTMAPERRRQPDRAFRRYARFGFESNQFQAFLADELQRRSNAAGLYLPVEPIVHTTDKLGRIQSLQPLVRSGTRRYGGFVLAAKQGLALRASNHLAPTDFHLIAETALDRVICRARGGRIDTYAP